MMSIKNFIPMSKMIIYSLKTNGRKSQYEKLLKEGKTEEAEKFLFENMDFWSKSILNSSKVTVEALGRENIPNETCLFASNHQSNLDIPVLFQAMNRPFGFVAKKELEKLPLAPYWMRAAKSIFLDRENPREGLKTINEGTNNLKSGYSMMIFPEGTRSKKAEMADFKKGSLRMALKAGVPIVPVSLDGSYKAMEGNNNVFTSARVKVYFGKPIYTDNLSKEDKDRIHEIVEEEVKNNLEMLRKEK